MSKEKIKVIDLAKNAKYPNDNDLHIGDWDTCRCIYKESTYYDSEKGFIDYDIVVQRKSDNKFFKFTYTDFGHGQDNIKEQIAYEVEEKEKLVKYYE